MTEAVDRTMKGESVCPGSLPNLAFGQEAKYDLEDRMKSSEKEKGGL